jgi:hypothetical protein
MNNARPKVISDDKLFRIYFFLAGGEAGKGED